MDKYCPVNKAGCRIEKDGEVVQECIMLDPEIGCVIQAACKLLLETAKGEVAKSAEESPAAESESKEE